ncbi:MAG TPA: alpha/beta fold hydrolase [Candidatus Limnocylindrales bacterium]|nr:alpha/beta fold hydrolase [Candidatus Limnocylindrales bacterium]
MLGTRRAHDPAPSTQEIRFLRAGDGVRLAYAVHGDGPPLVNVACWLSHLQFDWESPVWRHLLEDLGSFTTLVRYDERGSGLSDWHIADYSLDARVNDLASVVDQLGFGRVALLGMSQGGPVAIAYAARFPERVSHLVLLGTQDRGPLTVRLPADSMVEFETLLNLIRIGWARENPVFRRVFTNLFIPAATEEQVRWFDDLQRMSTSTENAARMWVERAKVNVAPLLSLVRAPTLVFHSIHDQAIGFGAGRRVARGIPGARFVPLESGNHILLEEEPAWERFVDEVRDFLSRDAAHLESGPDSIRAGLSARELEVLRQAADGRTNLEIADALTLSVRTVERHLSNAYDKLGVTGKAARAAAVARLVGHPGVASGSGTG